MKGVNKNIETYLDNHAGGIIANLGNKFDSHDFILKLLQDMFGVQSDSDAIIQAVDSQIGRYLSEKQEDLKIKDTERRVPTPNIKGTISNNEVWEKTSKN
ncbi:MAG: hypothetical protein LBL90_04230 [Prevotellaceae bacterium]|jgi:hypothetical protein|nr:hypothetical protein [Prevotellaceae bacterium]